MTCRVRVIFKAIGVALRRGAAAVYRFLGPVAGAIQGRVNPEEAIRVVAKATAVSGVTAGSLRTLIHDPDVQATILVPVCAGLLAGLMEYCSRKQQGARVHEELPAP